MKILTIILTIALLFASLNTKNNSIKQLNKQSSKFNLCRLHFEKMLIDDIEKESGLNIPEYANIDDIIFMYETANELKIPIRIVFRLIYTESRFVANPKNGNGYMQVLPSTYKSVSKNVDLTNLSDTEKNILIGMTYLKNLHIHWDSWKLAVASYKEGKGMISSYGGKIPPSAIKYVKFILK